MLLPTLLVFGLACFLVFGFPGVIILNFGCTTDFDRTGTADLLFFFTLALLIHIRICLKKLFFCFRLLLILELQLTSLFIRINNLRGSFFNGSAPLL